MSDTAKGILKAGAITGAVWLTGGAAAAAGLGWAKVGWTTAAMIGGLVQTAIAGRGLKSQIDVMNDGLIEEQAGRTINPTGTEVSLPIVYGKAKVGISIVDTRQAADVNTLALVGAIAIAPEGGAVIAEQGIQEVTNVYFNEQLALESPIFGANVAQTSSTGNPVPFDHTVVKSPWNGNKSSGSFGTDFWLEYFIHDGDDSQLVDYKLDNSFSAASWSTDARGVGVAYIVLWMYFDADIYTNGLPNVTMEIKGNKVANTQDLTDDFRYSENPADCIYDYMVSTRYGMGIPAAQIDLTIFSVAAAYCDEEVVITLSTGTVTLADRFTCNGFLMGDNGPLSNLERLLSSCCGRIVMEGGQYKLIIRKAQSAETFELNRTNIVGDWSFVRTGVSETPNTLVATYIDKDLNYQPQPVTWPEAGVSNSYLSDDNDYAVEARLELPFTEDLYMAEMIAAQQFLERRADMGCALVAQREALKLAVGDVVNVNHDTPSWTDQTMWVEAIGLRRDGLVQLALKEYDANVYTVPTMTVKEVLVGSNLPGRYTDSDSPTVQILNIDLEAVLDSGTLYILEMSLSFSGGMGSYKVTHEPDVGSNYNYTTDFTGTSTTPDLKNSAGTSFFPFDSDVPTGRSTITITPYPDASAGGEAGPPMTVTFDISA